jgi:hypothetical protein
VFIRIVRNNLPFSLLLIPLIGALLWLPGFVHPVPPGTQVYTPFYQPVDDFLRLHPVLSVLGGFLLSLAQAFMLNYIIYEHHLLIKKSWLPALLFTVLSACTPEMLWLHPQHIAGFFLLGALHLLLGTYRTDKAFGAVFNAGLLVGLAGLFYIPALLFLVYAVIVILLLRPFIWREWFILLFGALIPWIYSGVYFFWTDRLAGITNRYITGPILNRENFLKLPVEYYPLTVMIGFLLMVAAGRFIAGAGTSTLKTKKGIAVMIWFLFFGLMAVLLAQNYAMAGFLFAIYPLSLFISNYFLSARRLWLAETIFVLLLVSIGLDYVIGPGN